MRAFWIVTVIHAALLGGALPAPLAAAVERVTLRRDQGEVAVAGELVVEAQDGGVLLLAPDGELWAVTAAELVSRAQDDAPFRPLDAKQYAAELLRRLPEGFRAHHTTNYVICHNTSLAYAQWSGALLEKLRRGFYAYWSHRGWELQPPRLPLAAIIHESRESYARHTRGELGDAAASIVGYYSLRTNLVHMYDLTGLEEARGRERPATAEHLNRLFSRPEAAATIATVVHEATHQLAYNSGLQTRYADNPLWVSEGLAMFFETPDLGSDKGWRSIGQINPTRLRQFRAALSTRPAGALQDLLADQQRFKTGDSAVLAYAESWALNHYLLKSKPKEYVAYLQALAAKKPLIKDTPEERLREFETLLQVDIAALEAEFLRAMSRAR